MAVRGGMEAADDLRRELADLLRSNADEISARLEQKYVEEYPRSRANFMDAGIIHQWTLDEIESLARTAETGDPTLRSYQGQYGDAVVDPHEPELTAFACFVSACLFEARHIAPMLFQLPVKDVAHVRSVRELFERVVQDVIAYNCELYAASVKQAGSLIRTWDILSGMVPQGEPADTPAKRYLAFADDRSGAACPCAFPGEERLTDREREVLRLLVEGRTNGEIASALGLRQNTVKNHVAHIFDKCAVNTRVELTALVLGAGRAERSKPDHSRLSM